MIITPLLKKSHFGGCNGIPPPPNVEGMNKWFTLSIQLTTLTLEILKIANNYADILNIYM